MPDLDATLAKLDDIADDILRLGRVPGFAVAVVSQGTTVYSRGYGSADVANGVPMTARTVYPVASTTKAMNAVLIGALVDQGVLDWDRPVKHYMPNFALNDPVRSNAVSLRDLLSMRTGLPRHDWLHFERSLNRAALADCIRYAGLSAGFRERFQYNNIGVTIAGHVAELVTGRLWEDLVRERIFAPLAMSDTGCAPVDGDGATCSYREDAVGVLTRPRRHRGGVTAPSGGAVHSTVEDMAKWLAFNLDASGHAPRVVSPAALKETHTPYIAAGSDPSSPSADARYAMGWFVDHYRGATRLSHNGLLHDVTSSAMLFPDQHLGVVSFVNLDAGLYPTAVNQAVFDLVCGHEVVLGARDIRDRYEQQAAERARENAAARRIAMITPSRRLENYAGSYANEAYGEITIALEDGGLQLQRRDFRLALTHWHDDSWVAAEDGLFAKHRHHAFDSSCPIRFEGARDGDIVACLAQLEPAVAPIRFRRLPVASRQDRDAGRMTDLQQCGPLNV